MGASSAVIGLIIIATTLGLVARRSKSYKYMHPTSKIHKYTNTCIQAKYTNTQIHASNKQNTQIHKYMHPTRKSKSSFKMLSSSSLQRYVRAEPIKMPKEEEVLETL